MLTCQRFWRYPHVFGVNGQMDTQGFVGILEIFDEIRLLAHVMQIVRNGEVHQARCANNKAKRVPKNDKCYRSTEICPYRWFGVSPSAGI